MAKLKINKQSMLWIATCIFAILVQVPQNTAGSSCEITTTTEAPKTCRQTWGIDSLFSGRSGLPKSCSEVHYESGSSSSRLENCLIYPDGPNGASLEVLCDFETDGGGWTIIQKRSSGPQDEFNRTWTEYENGFGTLDKNFWLGLENIHVLTKKGDQELRIELEDFEGNKRYAKYSNFSVSDASDFFRLSIDGYSGNTGNSMNYPISNSVHNGMQFTTKDKDNDKHRDNCAVRFPGGWWFNGCFGAHLNGLYREKGETVPGSQGIIWYSWKRWEFSLAKTEMKIRSRN